MPKFQQLRLDQMDQQSKMKMVAKHLISPEPNNQQPQY